VLAMEDETVAKQGQKALQDAWFTGKDPVVIKEYVRRHKLLRILRAGNWR